MSDLADKLAPPERSRSDHAEARLGMLMKRWGCPLIDSKKPPKLIIVTQLDGKTKEWWKHFDEPGAKDPWYRLLPAGDEAP